MESTSVAMKIHISQSTRELIPADYKTTERGEITVKGKGKFLRHLLRLAAEIKLLHRSNEDLLAGRSRGPHSLGAQRLDSDYDQHAGRAELTRSQRRQRLLASDCD
jgi:hypothetical protein